MTRICAVAVAAAITLAACGSGAASITPASPSVGATPTASAALAAATETPKPTPKPPPSAIPRVLDFPTDGTCEPNHTCLGPIEPGKHHTAAFVPGFAFTTAKPGWVNLEQAGGVFDLHSTTAPGDTIQFFKGARAIGRDGVRVAGVDSSVAGLEAWLASNPAVVTTAAAPITIGGLKGRWSDVTIAPGATDRGPDCPTVACVPFLRGTDRATWAWDLGVASSERLRLYLLDWKDDVVAILVDSLDGTTFDALTAEADGILASVVFDKD